MCPIDQPIVVWLVVHRFQAGSPVLTCVFSQDSQDGLLRIPQRNGCWLNASMEECETRWSWAEYPPQDYSTMVDKMEERRRLSASPWFMSTQKDNTGYWQEAHRCLQKQLLQPSAWRKTSSQLSAISGSFSNWTCLGCSWMTSTRFLSFAICIAFRTARPPDDPMESHPSRWTENLVWLHATTTDVLHFVRRRPY